MGFDPMDSPPEDYGSDRYDYVEIQGFPGEPDVMVKTLWFLNLITDTCPDCRANVFLRWLLTDSPRDLDLQHMRLAWDVTIAHDESCPTLLKLEERA